MFVRAVVCPKTPPCVRCRWRASNNKCVCVCVRVSCSLLPHARVVRLPAVKCHATPRTPPAACWVRPHSGGKSLAWLQCLSSSALQASRGCCVPRSLSAPAVCVFLPCVSMHTCAVCCTAARTQASCCKNTHVCCCTCVASCKLFPCVAAHAHCKVVSCSRVRPACVGKVVRTVVCPLSFAAPVFSYCCSACTVQMLLRHTAMSPAYPVRCELWQSRASLQGLQACVVLVPVGMHACACSALASRALHQQGPVHIPRPHFRSLPALKGLPR